MAGSSLFALLDDIATILDDVGAMTKVAAQKTAGVLGDDLALNAEQVAGVRAERELPVVWAVAKGSFLNKAILIPAALALSIWLPVWVNILLMIGGAFLCFEGAEKLLHALLHRADQKKEEASLIQAFENPTIDKVSFERDKIKGAIRTDFILSAEIIVITLGVVQQLSFEEKLGVLVSIALLMTVGVYGFVAALVKLDDIGLWLTKKNAAMQKKIGLALLWFAPRMMRALSVIGTIAMFLVGGGILVHGLSWLHHLEVEWLGHLPLLALWQTLFEGVVGLLFGFVIAAVFVVVQKLIASFRAR